MDKQLIERIALSSGIDIRYHYDETGLTIADLERFISAIDAERTNHECGHSSLANELWAAAQLAPGEGIADGAQRIADILERIDAERGNDAKAWISDGFITTDRSKVNQWSQNGYEVNPLFLSPTIPEGMALVPIGPTAEMIVSGNEAMASPYANKHTVRGCYKAMLAVVQGKRNGN